MTAERSEDVLHDLDMSGVNSDGRFFQRCRCGWRSAPNRDAKAASTALNEHLLDAVTITAGDQRSG
jgi:hypothetical protein